VTFEGLNAALMLQSTVKTNDKLAAGVSHGVSSGVFCAGEMLDWEAPTGGYLLTGCLSSGFVAGRGAVQYLS
jgi:predicted flavoprotein YhiN